MYFDRVIIFIKKKYLLWVHPAGSTFSINTFYLIFINFMWLKVNQYNNKITNKIILQLPFFSVSPILQADESAVVGIFIIISNSIMISLLNNIIIQGVLSNQNYLYKYIYLLIHN